MVDGVGKLAKDMTVKVLRQELIANNLANVNTPGFKTQRAFSTLLKQSIKGPVTGRMGESSGGRAASEARAGEGEMTTEIYTSFQQGRIEYTHRNLDLAINGDGFFVVDTPFGERFTRSGSFTLTEAGLLATYGGNLVMGSGGPIAVQGEEVEITPDGSVVVDGEEVDTIKVVAFSNPEHLDRQGNTFASNNAHYQDVDFTRTQIVQGALERSNVNPIDEMVDMISLHRGFEASQRGIRLQIDASKKLMERVGDLD